jgi:hypothetical protein
MKLCDLGHLFVALASVYCRHALSPSVAENHQRGSNFRCSTNHFDCASRGALTFQDRTGLIMLTAITAIIIVLSIGILIAHALDAFRSG